MRDDHYRISLTDGIQVLQVYKNQMQHTLPGIRFPASEEPTFTFLQAYNRHSHIQEFRKFSELLKRSREKKRPQVLHRKYWGPRLATAESSRQDSVGILCRTNRERPTIRCRELLSWPGQAALKGMHHGFQVRVHGAWGTMCLPVSDEPTHSLRQWSILAILCLSVPLEVKEAWKADRTVCLRY